MDVEQNFSILHNFAVENGASLFGSCHVAELRPDFHLEEHEIMGLDFAVSIGIRLSRAVLDGIIDAPTLNYKWHYRQANIQLDKMAFLLSLKIQELGFRALPIAASQLINWRRQIGHLSHRHVAVAAGLGWLGRNNLLVHPEYGSQIRLVTILTSMPLPTTQPMEFSCGDCYACVEACPAEAIGETAADFNFQKCFELLDYFAKKKNFNLHICGVCVRACPGSCGRSLL
jgi:epoxyqueuosine reductase